MPGSEWKRPGDGKSNGVEAQPVPSAGWREPASEPRLGAHEVEDEVANLEIAFALDGPIRLSSASGGSPADAQSTPNLSPSAFVLSVGDREVFRGNAWRLVVCGLATVLVVVSLLGYLMASTLLTFGLLVGSLFVIPCAVGVLAHTGRLTDD